MEMGRVCQSGMGLAPLTFAEIDAFSRAVYPLDPREAVTIRHMSSAYLDALRKGVNPFFIPPWDGES